MPTGSETTTPTLSVTLMNFSKETRGGWEHLLDHARAIDDAGVDRLTVSDHVVFGTDLDAYGRAEVGGTEGGKQPTGPDGQWLEPLTVLSVVAGATSRVRLCTSILLAALRRPVVLAKAAATLDVLSSGRLDLGVGVGWQRQEYEAAGLPFGRRGKLLDHTLEVCQTLWRDLPARFESPELSFEDTYCVPQPVQEGGVPLWISGTVNDRVVERIARFGNRWILWGPAAAEPEKGIAEMRQALEAAGHDPAGLQVMAPLPGVRDSDGVLDVTATAAQVPALVEAGATDLRAGMALPPEREAATEQLAALVDAFRSAAGRPPR